MKRSFNPYSCAEHLKEITCRERTKDHQSFQKSSYAKLNKFGGIVKVKYVTVLRFFAHETSLIRLQYFRDQRRTGLQAAVPKIER